MHQGSVEFGHYYIYIYDFDKEVWRKYNDNEITEVQDTSEIFGKSERNSERANPPTPYFLVYVNAAMKNRLVEPVCREIEPEPSTVNDSVGPNTEGAMDVDTKPSSYGEVWAENGTPGMQTSSFSGIPVLPSQNYNLYDKRPVVQADQLAPSFW
jgi:ubiquitin carboxyl-terminal hydrolase 25/28